MENVIKLFSVSSKNVTTGEIIKSLRKGTYSVRALGFTIVASSLNGETYQKESKVVITEIGNEYKILGLSGKTRRKAREITIRG